MSLNGSGVAVINSAGQPVVATTLITAAAFNALTADLATMISTCVMKDGQQTITANIPFNSNKITGLGAGTARTDAASLATIQDGTGVYSAIVGGTADVITLTPSPAITAYAAGQTFRFIASGANTTNVTVAVSGLVAKAITKNGTTALIAGDIPSGSMAHITYDGTRFILGTPEATAIANTLYSVITPADNVFRVVGSSDSTKKLAFEVDGLSTATTRTLTSPDQDVDFSNLWSAIQDFRLSLTTGVPVTTADVTAAGTLYAVPYKGNRIALYNGTKWLLRNSSQFSLALTVTSGKPYDVFCYDNAGVPTLEVLVWTNDTTRATALAYQDGILVKSGTTTRRYLGTLYATGANITEDSAAKRNLWNYYHRVQRDMRNALETANSWAYTTATWRQANANAANQLECVIGVAEDMVSVHAVGMGDNASNIAFNVGIGVDSTSVNSAHLMIRGQTSASTILLPLQALYSAVIAAGRHTLVWLERSVATGTTTWYGDNGDVYTQTGIAGTIMD